MRDRNLVLGLLLIVLAVFLWSGIAPRERFTWYLEVFPVALGLPILVLTYFRFQLTPLLYILLAIHAAILLIGGHYTYAEVPWFNWIRDTFHLSRNHYDRLGHFAQGFVPAMLAREILLRKSPLKPGAMLFFLCSCICVAISAWYELLEWQVSLYTGTGGDAFLGTQGDIWDTQKDITFCWLGATVSLLTLSRLHDRQLRRVMAETRIAEVQSPKPE